MTFAWDNVTTAAACHLWATTGKSAAEIAADIGAPSRSVVIGKMHRLKVARPESIYAERGVKAPRRSHKLTRMIRDGAPPCDMPEPVPRPLPFLDIQNGRCRWPLWNDATPPGERMCCGRTTAPGSSYCPEHFARSRL